MLASSLERLRLSPMLRIPLCFCPPPAAPSGPTDAIRARIEHNRAQARARGVERLARLREAHLRQVAPWATDPTFGAGLFDRAP